MQTLYTPLDVTLPLKKTEKERRNHSNPSLGSPLIMTGVKLYAAGPLCLVN